MQRVESVQPTATIWIVDDHRLAALAVAEIAQGAGCTARAFYSAEEAMLALRESEPPEVLVTDLRLPGADGMALLRACKSASPATGVVVMTAFGSVEDAVLAIQAGAIDYLTKPLSVERVEVVLRNAIARSRDRRLRPSASSSVVLLPM